MSVARLTHVLDRADAIDVAEGLVAYERYQATLQRFADYYRFTLEQTVAAFCALSPNNDYKGNIKSLATLLHGIRSGWHRDEITVTTYNACRNRAHAFALGTEFLAVTKGPKTRNFYQNIVDPTDPAPVTVDGHMFGIWCGKRMTMVEAVRERIAYKEVAHGINQVAFSRCLRGNQAQAILWFTWKRMGNVVYSPQLQLFQDGDQWGTNLAPEDIPVFPRRLAA